MTLASSYSQNPAEPLFGVSASPAKWLRTERKLLRWKHKGALWFHKVTKGKHKLIR